RYFRSRSTLAEDPNRGKSPPIVASASGGDGDRDSAMVVEDPFNHCAPMSVPFGFETERSNQCLFLRSCGDNVGNNRVDVGFVGAKTPTSFAAVASTPQIKVGRDVDLASLPLPGKQGSFPTVKLAKADVLKGLEQFEFRIVKDAMAKQNRVEVAVNGEVMVQNKNKKRRDNRKNREEVNNEGGSNDNEQGVEAVVIVEGEQNVAREEHADPIVVEVGIVYSSPPVNDGQVSNELLMIDDSLAFEPGAIQSHSGEPHEVVISTGVVESVVNRVESIPSPNLAA
ncbi:hypothetical protein FRX31_033848, partial [Thalictrum thalictroides]